MPRMGGPSGAPEKSRDFSGSMKRLINGLNNWKIIMYIALILAMISAILALISPNKLSTLTDEITIGIKSNISEDVIKDIMKDPKISQEDKQELNKLMDDYKNGNTENMIEKIDDLPESITKKIEPKMNMNRIKSIALLLTILYILSALFNYIESYSMTHVSNRFAQNLRGKISSKINKLPLKYFDTHETGDVLSRVTNDVDTISQNLNNSLTTLVTSLTLFVGSIIMMIITNWIMAITAIIL